MGLKYMIYSQFLFPPPFFFFVSTSRHLFMHIECDRQVSVCGHEEEILSPVVVVVKFCPSLTMELILTRK